MAGEHPVTSVPVDTILTDDDQNIDALIIGVKWTTSVSNILTYSFVDSAADYSYFLGSGINHFSAFSAAQEAGAVMALGNFSDVADVVFVEETFNNANGTLRFGEVTGIGTAYGYYPNSSESGGDMAFLTGAYETPTVGSYTYATFLHEIGHAMGLKHGHETSGPGAMTADKDGMEYSVMTYNSFVGQNNTPGFYTNATGHFAQTLMMYDIAALQRLYGANFDTNSGNSVYTFSTTTGEMFINGVGQGTPGANVVFRTVWDGGGIDTYDLSNYTTNMSIDLTPGSYSNFDKNGTSQLAMVNSGWRPDGSFGGAAFEEYASGHLYNALLFEGDTSSLIENAIGGSGRDIIRGNVADNSLSGGGGRDILFGSLGEDELYGGAEKDKLKGGKASDTLYGGGGGDKLFGGKGHDTIYGSNGNDLLYGEIGKDTLFGGNANDRLEGGLDSDILTGGAHADTFVFDDDINEGNDRITDFEDGVDTIEIANAVYADLVITGHGGGVNTAIILTNGTKIILEGVSVGDITAADFDFV